MEFNSVVTTCPYCACGCGMHLVVLDGQIVQTLPAKTGPTNRGTLCIKGHKVHEFVQHPDRLKSPLIRENDSFRQASWDEALGHAAGELQRIRDTYGPESIGVLTSARCTNEENYLLQKFVRSTLGSNNVDHCARL